MQWLSAVEKNNKMVQLENTERKGGDTCGWIRLLTPQNAGLKKARDILRAIKVML